MSKGPVASRHWPQSTTLNNAGNKAAVQRAIAEESRPSSSILTGQQIGFFGHTQSGQHQVVVVLAGEGAPTVTGGWVKVAKIPRFQRVAFTIPEGYEPIELSIPIQFEAMVKVKERKNLEVDIKNLEWMAGRSPHPAGGETKGEPPYVEVYTTNSNGVQIPLVPLSFQGEPGHSKQWYMTQITYDPNPERDSGGARLRQKATVVLTEIVSTPSSISRNRASREAVKGKNEKFHSTKSYDTIKRIATHLGSPSSWEAILKANPKIASAEKKLKDGTTVLIPRTINRQVPG